MVLCAGPSNLQYAVRCVLRAPTATPLQRRRLYLDLTAINANQSIIQQLVKDLLFCRKVKNYRKVGLLLLSLVRLFL